MDEEFLYDVFLSYSSRDKSEVLAIAQRLRADGLRVWFDDWVIRPGDNIPAKIEEGLSQSRVLVLCLSREAMQSDWVRLERQTILFRDPMNKQRRFVPVRLDDVEVKGSLEQFSYIAWHKGNRAPEYIKLLEACQPVVQSPENPEVAMPPKEVLQFEDYGGSVYSYAFSRDGRCALTGSRDAGVRLWHLATGRCSRLFEGHTKPVECVAWSPDQVYALSGSDDRTVRVWEIETGLCVQKLAGHTDDVWGASWSPDQCYVSSGSGDRTIRVWDLSTGNCTRVLEGHTDYVASVEWSADQSQLLSCSEDGSVRVWEID